PDQRGLVERFERHRDRQATDQLRNQSEPQQVVRLDVGERIAGARALSLDLGGTEADLAAAEARFDDFFEPVERPAADEQDVPGVDLDVLLLRMLAPALRRDARHRPLEDLQQGLLHALARHVARDARVLALPRDLVNLVNVYDPALALGDVEVAGLQQPDENVLDVLAH